ncbi:MAG: hypothetical protein KatS3mg057_2922 [Herpetosiphonaceae bacterium]|nr:MAG: hypothetical protein KatS3mg057_2922 [Herpetosiphonaceae bacterium]
MIASSRATRLLVRQAGCADLHNVHAVTQAAFAEQRGRIHDQAHVFRESLDELCEQLEAGWIFLLAEIEGMTVGVIRLTRREGELYVGRLAVVPAHRRKGIGRALMAAAEAWGRAWGLSTARLGVREELPENRAYYESLGYCAVERLETRSAPGRYFYVMRKKLATPSAQPTPTAETIATYERYAARYARRTPYTWAGLALSRFAEHIPPPALVGAMGCGPGRELLLLLEQGYQLYGIDRTRAMLRMARATDAPLIGADLRSLPLTTAALDGVWASASLLHLPCLEIAIALYELRRVTRSGGGLMLTLKMGGGEEWRQTEDGPRFFAFYQPGEVRRLLAGAGFEVVYQWVNEPPPGQRDTWIATIARVV